MSTVSSGVPRPAASSPGQFASLTPLLAPRSIAVIGASSDATRIGGRPIAFMKNQGFKGALYPVNPMRAEIQGLKAYASIADLPEIPDVAIVAVPANIAVQAVSDLARLGVKGVVMFTAGFAEVDEAGELAQAGMKRADMIILQIDLNEGFPVEIVFSDFDLIQNITGKVQIFGATQLTQITRNITRPLEQHTVPFLQFFLRQIKARLLGKMRRAQQMSRAVIGPAMQRANNIAAGQIAGPFKHHRLAMAANIRNQINA